MKFIPLSFFLLFIFSARAQNVGIGTTMPNAKAALEVKSTDKGVLFPRLTTAQRNAITNPPDGLHIYNTDERCLNYFDSVNGFWNCVCDNCKTVVITISSNACRLKFYETFAIASPAKKYVINILPGVVISGCAQGDTALWFTTMPFDAHITINNEGTIAGAGGEGGAGTLEQGCSLLFAFATPGKAGGAAIATKTGVTVVVNNKGVVAGGGGGGGGSGKNPNGFGGGGGGGAGTVGGSGGLGGGTYIGTQFGGCVPSRQSNAGATGTATTGGEGGPGINGGANGGRGGDRGMQGSNGSGNSMASGGPAGKAIAGGSANIINNISGGQSFGVVE